MSTAGGHAHETVEVVPYDPAWPAQFEAERALLTAAVPGAFVSVEHVGSTAVPGLVAKPTIDILGVTVDLDRVLSRLADFEGLGYDYRPGSFPDNPLHLFFRKVTGGKRTHHLHVVLATSSEPDEYRLFRDFLTANPAVADRYAAIKRGLAERYASWRVAYVEAKQAEVDRLMEEARAWRAVGFGGGPEPVG